MRWLTTAFAAALMIVGGVVCWLCVRHYQSGGERNDETDVMLVLGGTAVLAGIFVMTTMAVTT